MNIESIILNLPNQGPAFWGAALAIALGATLLIVSLITQLRRARLFSPSPGNRFKFRGLRFRSGLSGNSATNKQNSIISKSDGSYQPAAVSPLGTGPAQIPALSDSTAELTARLHQAANVLEKIRQGIRQDNFSPGFSVLKHEPESVDYLFKTTTV